MAKKLLLDLLTICMTLRSPKPCTTITLSVVNVRVIMDLENPLKNNRFTTQSAKEHIHL